MDIVDYLTRPDVQTRLLFKKTISLATAKRWMTKIGYRWAKAPRGQYIDGHERKDVVRYRQDTFLPFFEKLDGQMRVWTNDGVEDPGTISAERDTVVWFHDESTFYANDRRKSCWVHSSATAVPEPKGEGASLMVADFISADHGWLRSPDGTEDARVVFKAGIGRDGYFINENIVAQAHRMMDVAVKLYPRKRHRAAYDNAPTHRKRPDGALSARKMPRNVPKEGTNWLIEVSQIGDNGQPVYGPDRKPLKMKVRMGDGQFSNGEPQALYFPLGHLRAGVFKGMATILEERGFNTSKLKAHFCNRSLRFMDAYRKGLDGRQAAWANRKYHGHRMLPDHILEELDETEARVTVHTV
ncbi:hypothetical protein B0H21DRAFT_777826 [Amylocystis lapponica]|nr:hypothetical protein B0H21DRAFT_777826 [Amylocystis lapponica]